MAFSFSEFFKNLSVGRKSVLGIDIGTSSIKVVQLRKEKERAVLETYGEIAFGPYANLNVGQAAKLPEAALINVIKDVLRESNSTAKDAAVAIPLKSSFVTVISLPQVADNISEIIRMETKKYIPVPLTEVSLDWWILPEKEEKAVAQEVEKKKLIHVLLAAIHNDVIANYKNIIAKTGLNAKVYEIECFSMVRSCIGRETLPVAILDVGASTAKLAIVDYGILKASHSVSKGFQDLTLALSHSLGVDFGRAEEMKREIGLSDLPEHREIFSVMEPVLDSLLTEIDILIGGFQKKYQRSVGKLLLAGGGAQLKGLAGMAVKRLGITVELADPFSKVEYPVFLANTLKETGVNFSVALGLALRAL